jgi:hypothetical protein
VPDARRRIPSAAAVTAWAAWAALTVLALAAVIRDNRNIPVGRDWRIVPAVTGHESEPVHWLWYQDGNDRRPAGRALAWAVVAATRDFRALGVVAVLGLAALGALLLRASQRSRGARWADLFLPVVLLQPAGWTGPAPSTVLMALVPLLLAGTILLAVVSDPALRTRRWSLLTALAMVTLPLTGIAGILVAAAAAPWVAACGWRHWPPRDPGVPLDAGPALLSFVFVAIIVTGMVFSDYDFSGWADPALDRGRLVLRAGGALAAALGPAGVSRWDLVAGVIAGLVLLTVFMLGAAGRRVHEVERYRVLGIACVLAGSALAVMMSAGGFAALLLCVVFLAWGLYGWPLLTVGVQTALLAAGLIVMPTNAREVARERKAALAPLDALTRDIAAGIPRETLAGRYRSVLLPEGERDELAARMAMVGEAGIGPLGRLGRAASAGAR